MKIAIIGATDDQQSLHSGFLHRIDDRLGADRLEAGGADDRVMPGQQPRHTVKVEHVAALRRQTIALRDAVGIARDGGDLVAARQRLVAHA